MSLFEAITTSFSVAGTGGFGIKNDSIASYSPYLQWVITIFMLLFGVNFNAYYLLLLRKWKNALKMEEVRYYFLIIAVAIGIIFLQYFTDGWKCSRCIAPGFFPGRFHYYNNRLFHR